MHVVLVSGSFPDIRCGVGDYVACLARALADRGIAVTVLTSWSERITSRPGIAVKPEIVNWRWPGLIQLLRRIRQLAPEVVHIQYPSVGYGRGLAINLLPLGLRLFCPSVKVAVTLHEYSEYGRLGKLRLWPMLAASQRVVCSNHQDRRALRHFQKGVRPKVRVIPLGSNVREPDARPWDRALPALPAGRTWLAHFGTVMPNKGWELLLPALNLLRSRFPDVGLMVVGALNPLAYLYHRRVQDAIRREGLEERIFFTGYLPAAAVGPMLRQCRIAVEPYRRGASLRRGSLVAVLAEGLAVVATQPALPLEGLRHGQQLWLVESKPQALADGLERLLRDDETVSRLQAGARRAAERFAWKRIAEQTAKQYDELTAFPSLVEGRGPRGG